MDEQPKRKQRWPKKVLLGFIFILLLAVSASILIRNTYNHNLKPLSQSPQSQLVTIPVGSTPSEIASMLEEKQIIRKSWAFEWYVRNQGVSSELLAGTYALRPSQSVEEIVSVITGGKIATDLVTIFPARRIDQVRDDLINQGFDAQEVDSALQPDLYSDHPALVDKPEGATLEGYLFPESFQKTDNTTAKDIVELSLDEMQAYLTPNIRAGFVKQGLTVHRGVILSSILEQEIGDSDKSKDLEDKKKAAQVFLKRLKNDIALESDATASYGAVLDGAEPVSGYSSAYNTYENPGLTPTPISNVGKNSLLAVAQPAKTDFLYFVTGNDCVNRFSRTLDEHEEFKRKHGIGCKE